MSRKKIAVLTMTSEPRLLLAGVDDGQVHIIKCDRLERSILSLKLTLPNKLKKLKEAGFVLLVDEVVPCFAKHGRAVRLSDTDAKGRPVIVSAMEAYNYLMGLGGSPIQVIQAVCLKCLRHWWKKCEGRTERPRTTSTGPN